jgi:2-iminobutanoate/2-iminopropanoate deaminase
MDPSSGKLKFGIREQAIQAFQNLKSVLEAGHSSMGAVLKTTVFLHDMNDFASVNEVYAQFFSEPFPARSAVQIAQLPMKGLIEIEAVAVIEAHSKE